MVTNYQNGVIAQLLQAILGQINFDGTPTSNIGDILLSILEQTPYDKEPKSVLAELFLKLKDKLEGRAFTPYDKEPKSAIAEILLSILNETEYDKEPNSRIAELLLELKAELESYAELTASGAIANFTTSVVKPLVNLTAYFKATQEAGTPTPQSPKAISGVSAVSVYKRAGNFFNSATKTDGAFLIWNSGEIYNDAKSIVSDYIEVKEGVKFSSNYFAQWCCYDKEKNYLGNIVSGSLVKTSGSDKKDNTIPSGYGVYYLRLGYRSALNNDEDMTEKTDIVLNVGDTATAFEPYNGSTTLINLGGTYYGGYVSQDKDGKRELGDTFSNLVNLADLTFNPTTKGGHICFYANLPDGVIKAGGEQVFLGECSSYTVTSDRNLPNDLSCAFYCSELYSGYSRIIIRDDSASDMTGAQFKAYVTGQIIFEKDSQQTIPLPDGEPITAFNGVNNIYNDSGDTSVTYLAKIADNLNTTAKLRAEVKAQKLKAKEALTEELKEDVKELEPVKDSSETKRGA